MAVQQLDTQSVTAVATPAAVDISGVTSTVPWYQLAVYNAGANPVWLLNATESAGASGICIPAGTSAYSPVYNQSTGAPRLYAAASEACKVTVLLVTA